MRKDFFLMALGCMIFLNSFISRPDDGKLPKTITKTSTTINGKKVEKTAILLDGRTSREDLIHTCQFLAQENIQLTFAKLTIGKSFLGLVGKQRIRIAEGMITLSNGSSQRFKAGGATGFRSLKIQYSNHVLPESSQIEMIEVVD